jgi:glyoxylate reductase
MKPKILITRAIFPDVIQRLEKVFEVDSNISDRIYSEAELIEKCRDKDGIFSNPADRVSANFMQACPQL